MRGPLRVMIIIIAVIVVIAGGGAGAFTYLKHHHKSAGTAAAHTLTAKQAAALQVTLPQMTTNLNSSGLIQFTLTLQADKASTKQELTLMQNQISDSVNEIMRQFTPSQLRDDKGINELKASVATHINAMLQNGRVTHVYLSQVLVQ